MPGGELGVVASISMPYLPNCEPFESPVPANSQGATSASGDRERLLPLAAVVREVLVAEQGRLGLPLVAPLTDEACHVARPLDVAEEVVRREEDQVAAEIAVAASQVVQPLRDVLRMAGEDDQVVGRPQRLRRRRRARCPRRRTCRRRGRARRASGGTGPRSCGSARARRAAGAAGRGRCACARRASTRCRRSRRRCGRSSCRPARSSSAARSRRAEPEPAAGRRSARSRGGRRGRRGAPRRGRSREPSSVTGTVVTTAATAGEVDPLRRPRRGLRASRSCCWSARPRARTGAASAAAMARRSGREA